MHQVENKAQIYASAEEALLKTKRIWEVLAEQDLRKYEVYQLLGLQIDRFYCPYCQYNKQETEKLLEETGTEREACHFCPLYPESDFGCDQEGEPFHIWSEEANSADERKEAATAFLSLVNKALSEIGESQS